MKLKMKLLLSILLNVAVFDCLAAPVNQPNEQAPTSLQTKLNDLATIRSELAEWKDISFVNKDTSTFFENTAIPCLKRSLKIMDTPVEGFQAHEITDLMTSLASIVTLLQEENFDMKTIVESYRSFDDEAGRRLALNRFLYNGLVRRINFRKSYYKIYHDHEEPQGFLDEGLKYLKGKRKDEKIVNLYETKKTAEETMSQSFEKLRKNPSSFEQIDQFFTIYDLFLDFFKDMETPIFKAERELNVKINDHLASDTTLDNGSCSNHAESSMSGTTSDLTAVPSANPREESSDSEPSAKRQKLESGSHKNLDNFGHESNPLFFVISKLLQDQIVDIQKGLERWNYFVKDNQPIDASELLSSLTDCIKIMKQIEPYILYFPLCKKDYLLHEIALQTLDGFHDLLKKAAMSLMPVWYFNQLRWELPEDLRKKSSEKLEPKEHIIPKKLIEEPIFIEFCLTYFHLLLQNNCRKLRMKPPSMINLKEFVDQNRLYVRLIKTYQPIFKIYSIDQTAKLAKDGILQDLERRARNIYMEKFQEFFEESLHSDEDLETFVESMEILETVELDQTFTPWLEYHVPELLDLQPIDINVNSHGHLYIDYDPNDKRFESRRLC